jgi:hypothetical protein
LRLKQPWALPAPGHENQPSSIFGAKSPEGKAWRTHFEYRVGTLPTPGHSRKTGVEKVSTRHVENVRHVNSQAKVKPAGS